MLLSGLCHSSCAVLNFRVLSIYIWVDCAPFVWLRRYLSGGRSNIACVHCVVCQRGCRRPHVPSCPTLLCLLTLHGEICWKRSKGEFTHVGRARTENTNDQKLRALELTCIVLLNIFCHKLMIETWIEFKIFFARWMRLYTRATWNTRQKLPQTRILCTCT